MRKKDRVDIFKKESKRGPKIVIDCEFEHMMMEKEIKSMGS